MTGSTIETKTIWSNLVSASLDPDELWNVLRAEVEYTSGVDDILREPLHSLVECHPNLADATCNLLARQIEGPFMQFEQLRGLARTAMAADSMIIKAVAADLVATRIRDPAAESYLIPFLHYKGFHALECHRVAHWLWRNGRRHAARFIQSRVSEVFAVDIHPAVTVGSAVFIDHGTGIVIGETAAVGNAVSILHGVTLGATGKERGDRHPKVRDSVFLSVGAKILGNIEIGEGAQVAAGSVVLQDVPTGATVAGIPARIVGWRGGSQPMVRHPRELTERTG
jgi:serine O-acetyltransferase